MFRPDAIHTVAACKAAVKHHTAGLNASETPRHLPRGPVKISKSAQSYLDNGTYAQPSGSDTVATDMISMDRIRHRFPRRVLEYGIVGLMPNEMRMSTSHAVRLVLPNKLQHFQNAVQLADAKSLEYAAFQAQIGVIGSRYVCLCSTHATSASSSLSQQHNLTHWTDTSQSTQPRSGIYKNTWRPRNVKISIFTFLDLLLPNASLGLPSPAM